MLFLDLRTPKQLFCEFMENSGLKLRIFIRSLYVFFKYFKIIINCEVKLHIWLLFFLNYPKFVGLFKKI